MLAPFFVNLLAWCVLMLFVGWVLDLVNGWIDSGHQGDSLATRRRLVGSGQRYKPQISVCVGCDISQNSLLRSGMTKGRENA
jgi:hypothetical protein